VRSTLPSSSRRPRRCWRPDGHRGALGGGRGVPLVGGVHHLGAPAGRPIRTCSATRACNLARWASPMTGARPAHDTKFGSFEDGGEAVADSHPAGAPLCVECVIVASHILRALQGIRASRPAQHPTHAVDSGLVCGSPEPCPTAWWSMGCGPRRHAGAAELAAGDDRTAATSGAVRSSGSCAIPGARAGHTPRILGGAETHRTAASAPGHDRARMLLESR
jgi:hypothetical protein